MFDVLVVVGAVVVTVGKGAVFTGVGGGVIGVFVEGVVEEKQPAPKRGRVRSVSKIFFVIRVLKEE